MGAMPRPPRHHAAIRTLIADAPGPLSAEEVREALSDTGVGQATVYRALKAAAEDGTLKAVDLPTGPTRYEPADRPHHHHFHCDACGRVYDLPGCPGGLRALLPDGFTLDRHEVLLFGHCEACA